MVDKYLAWINVRIRMYQEAIERTSDPREKHDNRIVLKELEFVKNSYCRNRVVTNG